MYKLKTMEPNKFNAAATFVYWPTQPQGTTAPKYTPDVHIVAASPAQLRPSTSTAQIEIFKGPLSE